MLWVDKEKCKSCGTCVNACPVQAISLINEIADIDSKKCIECEKCINVCPVGAINSNLSSNDISSPMSSIPSLIGKGFSKSRGFSRGGFARCRSRRGKAGNSGKWQCRRNR